MIKTLWFHLTWVLLALISLLRYGQDVVFLSDPFPHFFHDADLEAMKSIKSESWSNESCLIRGFFKTTLWKNVSTGIRCHSERIMSISFIGMSASCGSGHKACYVGGSEVRWTQWWIPCISWISLLETVATSLFHLFSQSFRMSRCTLTSKIRVE